MNRGCRISFLTLLAGLALAAAPALTAATLLRRRHTGFLKLVR